MWPFFGRSALYNLSVDQSPSAFQLAHYLKQAGWRPTSWNFRASFSERHLDFAPEATESLEFKDRLARLSLKHFPEAIPLSFPIDDQNWPQVLAHLQTQEPQHKHQAWILKPALLNNGQHLKIFETLDQLERHYLSAHRLGGPHLLQHYLSQPHLLKGPKEGHKYSLRMFLILCDDGAAYLYPQGYFNIALQPYPGHRFDDLRPHLTNEHLSHDEANVIQIPTDRYELFKPFFPKIQAILKDVVLGLQTEYPEVFENKRPKHLAFFGFDFMVDQHEKVWLLEANHGPCFPVDENHPLQKTLYQPFWQAVVEEIIEPLAFSRSIEVKRFLKI